MRVLQKAFPADGRFVGVAFVDERLPDEKEWDAKKDAFIRQLSEQKKARVFEAYLSDRTRQFNVKIDPNALK